MSIDAPETEVVTTWKVACDGGEGALGHPRVWLTIPQDTGWVECGYCDKRYVIDRDHDQYCGGISLEEQAEIIARAIGGRGSNRDYLWAIPLEEVDLAQGALKQNPGWD